ncbi:MAG: hypothetical protein E7618_07990 [Ruminococcaceae bacterium]|nr:hypothetical protein [Oscillospiraceae bacterium]
MKLNAKFLAGLLALLMLMATFVACTNGDGPAGSSTDAATTDAETEGQELYVADYLPATTYDGRQFRIGTFGSEKYVLTAEDVQGNVVDNAVYKRQSILEDRYDVTFFEKHLADSYDMAFAMYQTNFITQNDVYDIGKNIMRNAWLATVNGMVIPVSTTKYCDPEQPWYLPHVNSQLEIDGTLFYAYTYEADTILRGMMTVFFNKRILEDNQDLEDPYQLVADNEWTIDKMHEMMTKGAKDVNGDTKWTLEDDIWGMITEDDMHAPSMWMGAGLRMVEKDPETGMPYFSALANQKFFDILDSIYDYTLMDGVFWNGFSRIGQTTEALTADLQGFNDGHGLFYLAGIYRWEGLTDMVDDFGVLPLPKYDETQELYYSRVCDGTANCIPFTNPDLDFTSLMLEALAVESLNYYVPAYFEDAIENRFLRDPEQSLDLLRSMQANTILDLGDSIWMSTMREIITFHCFRSQNNTFKSTLDANLGTINSQISGDVEKLGDVLENLS